MPLQVQYTFHKLRSLRGLTDCSAVVLTCTHCTVFVVSLPTLPLVTGHQGVIVKNWTRRWFELYPTVLLYRMEPGAFIRARVLLSRVSWGAAHGGLWALRG